MAELPVNPDNPESRPAHHGRPLLPVDPARFQRQLSVATFSLVLVLVSIELLQRFASILQPLLIALFIAYVILPIHDWLVRHRVPSTLAYVLILIFVILSFLGVGRMVYGTFNEVRDRWPVYELKLDRLLIDLQSHLPTQVPQLKTERVSDLFQVQSIDQIIEPLRSVIGTFIGFFTGLLIVGVYMAFLIAEVVGFPKRVKLAFGDQRAENVMAIVRDINTAIAQYISVKTLMSILTGLLSMVVLAIFSIPFLPMWGMLFFLLNYIPYLGNVIAMAGALLICLLEYTEQPATVIVIAVILVAVQQILGYYVEPKMMGRKLNVSPLLILLSVSFGAVVWGIVGMIVAVPLLVVFKIVLDNIPETRAISTLMSNP